MSEQINAFEMAQEQFDGVAKMLNLDQGIAEVLRWPCANFRSASRCAWTMAHSGLSGLPCAAQRCARPEQGRHPLPSG